MQYLNENRAFIAFSVYIKNYKELEFNELEYQLKSEKGTSRTSPKNKIKLKIKIKVEKDRKKKNCNREDQQKPKVVSLKRPIRRLLWRSHRL